MLEFDIPKEKSSIIKVIGIGGGGSNAVNYMYSQGITGVNYVICNTDIQALEASPVPNKIQLGKSGLGAGSKPEVGRLATEEALDLIDEILQSNTEMIFITAGMGGGTGTGGAPVLARAAKDMGILTVAIVTMPFKFEGKKRRLQAEEGIKELGKEVDALLVVSNDKLREIHGNLKMSEAFSRADDILTTAAKGIAEIITVPGEVNVDFNDVSTVMKDSGVALMGTGIASGPDRSREAIQDAMNSPLLNDNNILGAKYILLNIVSGTDEITMDEVGEITDFVTEAIEVEAEKVILGVSQDHSLGDQISITLIATGFESNKEREKRRKEDDKVVYVLPGEGETATENLSEKEEQISFDFMGSTTEEIAEVTPDLPTMESNDEAVIFELNMDDQSVEEVASEDQSMHLSIVPESSLSPTDDHSNAEPVSQVFRLNADEQEQQHDGIEETDEYLKKNSERIERLKSFSVKFGKSESDVEKMEKQPAYLRRNVDLEDSPASDESEVSRFSLKEGEDGIEFGRNTFLHDNVD